MLRWAGERYTAEVGDLRHVMGEVGTLRTVRVCAGLECVCVLDCDRMQWHR